MKKIWYLIGLIMLLITIYEVSSSYAKYVTKATGTGEGTAGEWVIKVNQADISSAASEKKFTVDNLIYEESDYVVEGKIAPSSRGHFDITIDPTGTSVAVRFDINIDSSEMTINDSIKLESAYKVVNGEEVAGGMTKTADGKYSGIITLNEVKAGTPVTARIYILWEESEGSSDSNDSIIGSRKDSKFNLPVAVTVSQYSGEEIT